MSEDFLKDPLALFSVKGKVAIVTGASGAFGALAAKVLAGAGAKLVLSAGKKAELDAVSDACRALGADVDGTYTLAFDDNHKFDVYCMGMNLTTAPPKEYLEVNLQVRRPRGWAWPSLPPGRAAAGC